MAFSKIRLYVLIAAFCILFAGIGYNLGERKASLTVTPDKRIVVNQQPPASTPVDFSLFWDVWQRLSRSYIDQASLNTQGMVWGAISGMVNSIGDPYTIFLPPKENSDFKSDLGGSFEGIGAELGLKDGHVIIVTPLKGNPAEKAGIKAGDYILKVNDEDTNGGTVAAAVAKIRGPRGTSVTLSILHSQATKPQDIVIVRDTIKVPSVVSWVKAPKDIVEISGTGTSKNLASRNEKIAYIELSRFGDNTNDDWGKAVDTIVEAQRNGSVKGVIFDLRNNPGGYLDGAVYIASEFIRSGTVVSQVNSNGTKEDYPVVRAGRLLDVPVVVLINKGSASAAEITAGALQDYKRATLVGETSFGKGSVQTPEELPGGAGLHITTGKWLLPNGSWINKKGVTPDVVVSSDDSQPTSDAQLAKAVELLLK